jgi:hypothetical protein
MSSQPPDQPRQDPSVPSASEPNPYGQTQPPRTAPPQEQSPYDQSAHDQSAHDQSAPYQSAPYQSAQYSAPPDQGLAERLPPYGQPYPAVPQPHPQGTIVLVLGILGLVFGLCAPFAWYFGSKAQQEIAASGVRYSNEDQIKIGRILGMIITILMIVGLVIGLIGIIVAVVVFTTTTS